jgi:hypothetical protein
MSVMTTPGHRPVVHMDLGLVEQQIRSMAAHVVSLAATRRVHPSYGVSKTQIREAAARMEGAIGLYMVLTDQANHAGVSNLAAFQEDRTDLRVNTARDTVKGL